jgi:hypothetical protein
MAVGIASVAALCAGADTALALVPEGPAPACAPCAWTQPGAEAGVRGLKRQPVATPWDAAGNLPRFPAPHGAGWVAEDSLRRIPLPLVGRG